MREKIKYKDHSAYDATEYLLMQTRKLQTLMNITKGVRKGGGLGLKPSLELDILKNFLPSQGDYCFRILFAC